MDNDGKTTPEHSKRIANLLLSTVRCTLFQMPRFWFTVNDEDVELSVEATDCEFVVDLLRECHQQYLHRFDASTLKVFKRSDNGDPSCIGSKEKVEMINFSETYVVKGSLYPPNVHVTFNVGPVHRGDPSAAVLEKLETRFEASITAGFRRLSMRRIPGFEPPSRTERTPFVLATDELKVIGLLGEDKDIAELPGGTAVLSEEEFSELARIKSEAEMVAFMTPIFAGLFSGDGRVVANSETNAFLPATVNSAKADQKPDLTMGTVGAYRKITPPNGLLRFNVPVLPMLDAVNFLDGKITLTVSAYGELLIHLQLQGDNIKDGKARRGMLFAREGFWLAEVQDHRLIRRWKGNWTTKGSCEFLKRYFKPLPWGFIGGVAASTGHQLLDPDVVGTLTTAYLGAGAFGRVFAVHPADAVPCMVRREHLRAMKVTHGTAGLVRLAREYQCLSAHADVCDCSLLARPVGDSAVRTYGQLHGFVMVPVGQRHVKLADLRFPRTGLNECLKVFNALRALHTHNPPICHGDARLANLMYRDRANGELFWIDLVEGVRAEGSQSATFTQLVLADVLTLAGDCLFRGWQDAGLPTLADFDLPIQQAIGRYLQEMSVGAMNNVAVAVHVCMPKD